MNSTSEPRGCPKCGEVIPAEAPQGLCPKCLLQQASFGTDTGTAIREGSLPPRREELAAAFPQLEILDLIGQGGMGFVFKARQAKLDRLVALKILPQSLASRPAFAERFAREGRMLARLSHPNIVTIYDFGQANGFFYLLMECVDGVNLRQALRAGRFTPDQTLAIVPKICDALQYAHTEGILHRDIKPENILLDAKGRLKIADFGIAKLVGEPDAASTLTAGGGALGTVHYMAPEQIEKPSQVDHRADIYSLGVVFYELLTGELPIGRFAPPSENSGVDPRIDEVVFRALDKQPERRPQSAGEVKTQVETITAAGAPPPPQVSDPAWADLFTQETPSSSWTWRRGWRKGLLIAAGAGLLMLGIFAVGLLPKRASQPVTQVVPDAVGGEVSANEPFDRTFVLSRATNQVIGEAGDTWGVGVWSDTPLPPGEMLSARVRLNDEPISDTGCNSLFFLHTQPDKVGTSAAFTWFFGGHWREGFGETQAEAALAQLSDKVSAGSLTLSAGKPFTLFSVTNDAGSVLAGCMEFTRYVPRKAGFLERSAPQPQAIVHVRRFAAFLPSLGYSVKLPPGYALRTMASMGNVTTSFGPGAARGEYHSSWYIPIEFRRGSSPESYRDLPAQMKAQQAAIETRFQELQDLGPIAVPLGQPFTVFCLTNKSGEVYRSWFELVDPFSPGATNPPATLRAALRPTPALPIPPFPPLPKVPHTDPPARRSMGAPLPLAPTDLNPSAIIEPATGLPVSPGSAASATVDPRTGLPASTARQMPSPSRLKHTNDVTPTHH